MRILMDCTNTHYSGMRTGIQRDVIQTVRHAAALGPELGLECIPVVLRGNGAYRPRDLFRLGWPHRWRAVMMRMYFAILKPGGRGDSDRPEAPSVDGRPGWPEGNRAIRWRDLVRHTARRCLRALAFGVPDWFLSRGNRAVPFQDGDVLLLRDASWAHPPWTLIEKAAPANLKVLAIVHDLIPLSHPQFMSANLTREFGAWLLEACRRCTALLCVSAATESQLAAYCREHCADRPPVLAHFHWGVDPIEERSPGALHAFDPRLFQRGPVYLMVGTLEPRKNHAFVLDAFEELWKSLPNVQLAIVGKAGWLVEPLLKRIRSHPRHGSTLHWWTNVTDGELDYLYRHGRALIAASVVEGFGTPIIEALSRRLPVFASDIPPFREVGGDFCVFFSLASPRSLRSAVEAYERTEHIGARPVAEFTWPSWRESTRSLLQLVQRTVATAEAGSKELR